MNKLIINKYHPNFEAIKFCATLQKSINLDYHESIHIYRRRTVVSTNTRELHTGKLKDEMDSGWYTITKNTATKIILKRKEDLSSWNKLVSKRWGKFFRLEKDEYIRLSDIDLLTDMGNPLQMSREYTLLIREMKYNIPEKYKELLIRLGFNPPLLNYNYSINIDYLKNLKGYRYKAYLPKHPVSITGDIRPMLFISDNVRAAVVLFCL